MIQLSPQVTVPANAGISESPNAGAAEQKTVKEKDKDDKNTFSKLLAGLLNKIKTASGTKVSEEASVADFPEAMTGKTASHLSKLKFKGEDETNDNEGIAALFVRMDERTQRDFLPRKFEDDAVVGGMMVLEKKVPRFEESDSEGLTKKFSLESETEKTESVTDTAVQADSLAENPGTEILQNEISAGKNDAVNLEAGKQKTGLVDALKAETEKSSVVTQHLFNHQAKPGLVDAGKSTNADTENAADGKIKDKRKERLAALEAGNNRVQVSQESPQDGTSNSIDGDFSHQKIDADIVVELRDGRGQSEERGLARETRSAQSFQDMLSRELRDGLNTEIVRHASLVLKENGEGLIRLSLRPDSLGNIKIRLEMADNKVTGRIVFETDEALKAFEKEIQSLEQSFVDSGFDGAALEMALSSDHQNDRNGQQWKGGEARPFFSERFVSSIYEGLTDYDEVSVTAGGRSLVDVLV